MEAMNPSAGVSVSVTVPRGSVPTYQVIDHVKQHGTEIGKAIAEGFEELVAKAMPVDPDGKVTYPAGNLEDLYAFIRHIILSNPQDAAAKLGIPELARLASLPAPEPALSLRAVGDMYKEAKEAKGRYDANMRKWSKWWDEFAVFVGVPTVDQLTKQHFADYANHLYKTARRDDRSNTYIRGRMIAVSAIIRHAVKVHDGDYLMRAEKWLDVFDMPSRTMDTPQPITPEHFKAILDKCNDPMMTAILHMSLNCCLKPKDFTHIKLSDVRLDDATPHYWGIRHKTADKGIPQASVLWGRTVQAIRQYLQTRTRGGDFLFVGGRGLGISRDVIGREWLKLRTAAGVPDDVQFQHIVDGAYTCMDNATDVEARHRDLVKGHACGMSKHYSLKDASSTRHAVDLVEKHYFAESDKVPAAATVNQ
jgi:integrase